jgi:hypothetical protein
VLRRNNDGYLNNINLPPLSNSTGILSKIISVRLDIPLVRDPSEIKISLYKRRHKHTNNIII